MAYPGFVPQNPDYLSNIYGGTGSRFSPGPSVFADPIPSNNASGEGSQGYDPDYAGAKQYSMTSGKSTSTSSTAFGTNYPTGAAAFFGAPQRASAPSTYNANQGLKGASYNVGSGSMSAGGGMGNISYTAPTMPMPTMGALPTYNAPEMDRARISELAELSMGAPMGRLKQGLNRAMIEARYSNNPNIRNLARKSALSGYGSGVADIRAGAQREGMAGYMPEFQAAQSKAGAEYAAGVGQVNTKYQADMNAYLQSLARINAQNQQIPLPGGSYGAPTQFQQPRLDQFPTFNYPTIIPRYNG